MTPEERQELEDNLMAADLKLKQTQSFWETPRNLTIILAAFTAIVATLAGLAGYKAGQTASIPQQIIIQPGAIQLTVPK
jgi:hypothetical protein